MKQFDLFKYIKKFQIPIFLFSLIAGIAGFVTLSGMQSYTASAIIRYSNAGAVNGVAPDGTEIDTTEIYSSKVIAEVLKKMGLEDSNYSVDDLRSRVTVTAIRTEGQEAIDAAKITQGEPIEELPVDYEVSFTAVKKDEGALSMEEFARQFLDQMLDVYVAFYGEKHINTGTASNDISGLNMQNYDYLEMAEIINASIENAQASILQTENSAGNFRSSRTGYSFSDLRREFNMLDEVEMSNVFSYILENRVTRNPDVLIAKYENRIHEHEMNNENSEEQVAYINRIIDTYVTMMRESGNTNITYEYILNEVHDSFYTDENDVIQHVDQTVEYDQLLESYISERSEYENALIDIAYCQYIIDLYRGTISENSGIAVETGNLDEALAEAREDAAAVVANEAQDPAADAEAQETEQTPLTAENVVTVSTPEVQETADNMISSLVEKLNELYKVLETVNSEYNEYAGAQNVNMVASVALRQGINLWMYTVLIVIVFGLIGCIGAVVTGRLQDIFEWYVYVDRHLGIPNRAACDQKILQYSKSLLKDEFVCIAINIPYLKEKNRKYGRERTDAMIDEFIMMVKNIFSHEEKSFLGVNGVGQFLVFGEDMTYKRACTYMEQLRRNAAEYNRIADCRIEYTAGIAEAGRNDEYRIKNLLLQALQEPLASAGIQADGAETAEAKMQKTGMGNRSDEKTEMEITNADNMVSAMKMPEEAADTGETQTLPNQTELIEQKLEELRKALEKKS